MSKHSTWDTSPKTDWTLQAKLHRWNSSTSAKKCCCNVCAARRSYFRAKVVRWNIWTISNGHISQPIEELDILLTSEKQDLLLLEEEKV